MPHLEKCLQVWMPLFLEDVGLPEKLQSLPALIKQDQIQQSFEQKLIHSGFSPEGRGEGSGYLATLSNEILGCVNYRTREIKQETDKSLLTDGVSEFTL